MPTTPTPANTVVTINLPTARTDGSALALTEIASCVLSKANGSAPAVVVDTLNGPFTSATQSFTDTSPDFGDTDNYSATVTDVEGNTSAVGVTSVAVPPSVLAPPNAPTLSAVFNPASAA